MEKGVILVVDDDENVRKALSREINVMGYEFLAAADAKSALEILKTKEVDVIISDQRMPGVQGTGLLRIVKDIYPEVIRIMLTGFADFKSVLQAINENEVYRLYMKPWDSKELFAGIANGMRIRSMRTEKKRLLSELSEKVDTIKMLDANEKTIRMGTKEKDGQ
jgi:DNA-binding NtrC family response regulator